MPEEKVLLWLTRDRAGTNIWRRRPRYCFGSEVYFCGGETLTLAEEAFPRLHLGACVQVEVSIPEK